MSDLKPLIEALKIQADLLYELIMSLQKRIEALEDEREREH